MSADQEHGRQRERQGENAHLPHVTYQLSIFHGDLSVSLSGGDQ